MHSEEQDEKSKNQDDVFLLELFSLLFSVDSRVHPENYKNYYDKND